MRDRSEDDEVFDGQGHLNHSGSFDVKEPVGVDDITEAVASRLGDKSFEYPALTGDIGDDDFVFFAGNFLA